MQFQNASVQPGELPGIEEAEWVPIERDYLKVLRIQWLIFSLALLSIGILASFLISTFLYAVLIPLGVILTLSLYFFLQERAFSFRAYCIRQHDIMYRSGWIVRTITVCPFNRIQHCQVRSGPLERNYKLASVTVYTAGSGSDLRVPGLPEKTALSIREFIMKKISVDEPANN